MLALIGILNSHPDHYSNHQNAVVELNEDVVKQLKSYQRLAKQAKKLNPELYSHRYTSDIVMAAKFQDPDALEDFDGSAGLGRLDETYDWEGTKLFIPEMSILEVTEDSFSFNFMALDELGLMTMYETETFTLDNAYWILKGARKAA